MAGLAKKNERPTLAGGRAAVAVVLIGVEGFAGIGVCGTATATEAGHIARIDVWMSSMAAASASA